MPNRPPRLDRLHEEYVDPVWYVTFNTRHRAPLLANGTLHAQFLQFSTEATARNILIGRYVIMPDHVHLFVDGGRAFDPGNWVRSLKLSLSKVIARPRPHWQEGSFKHLMRNYESYAEKWSYVRDNPVRAMLADNPEEWPFQGEIHPLRLD